MVPLADVGGNVLADYVPLSDGTMMAELIARPGERIVLDTGNPRLTSEVLERFAGLREAYLGQILVNGNDLSVVGPKDLRRLVGYAAQGMRLVRGSVSRNVRYRSPDTGPEEADRLLAEVDLADRVAGLAEGPDTMLIHGGEPLSIPERARLLLARAMLDDPPLLVFDHLDADLGAEGRTLMRRLLADYRGVVILASDDPDQIVTPTHHWRPEGVDRVATTLSVG
jgi:ABC-type multidrug transport system fused ATPase/permease subunit